MGHHQLRGRQWVTVLCALQEVKGIWGWACFFHCTMPPMFACQNAPPSTPERLIARTTQGLPPLPPRLCGLRHLDCAVCDTLTVLSATVRSATPKLCSLRHQKDWMLAKLWRHMIHLHVLARLKGCACAQIRDAGSVWCRKPASDKETRQHVSANSCMPRATRLWGRAYTALGRTNTLAAQMLLYLIDWDHTDQQQHTGTHLLCPQGFSATSSRTQCRH